MTDINEDDIRQRAFALWEADGRPEGKHDMHWQQAVQELTAENDVAAIVAPYEPAKASKLSVVTNEATAEPAAKKRDKTL